MSFYKLKDYDSLAVMDSKMLQIMIEDFVMKKKSEGLSSNGIKNHLSPLELFCDANGLEIKWKKINRLLPEVGKRTGGKPYTTEHIALMLEFERVMRNKAIIHFLAATGVRVGAIQDIKLKHVIDFKEDCKMVTVYADTKDEYVTFLTPEASMILDIYLEKRKNDREYLNPESPLFRTTYQFGTAKAVAMKKTSVCGVINRGLERTGLRVTNTSKRYDIQIDHGFRKRWNTIVKNTDGMKIILAEKMMGHAITIPLDDTYNVPVFEKLFQEYKKAISELTIDESERLRIKNEQQQKKITELEVKNARIEKLERRMRVIEKSKER
ncbi:MAG: hypothetical protein COY74_09775 [Nitrosopumilales archaeon CG_4_10_14_0_8_um_filter_34_8]|nr:MAG: hypothetical protein COY74_09775 [Nitrosopumilales archaeon CG_4_10_14_0_8_um_filter_34_8]